MTPSPVSPPRPGARAARSQTFELRGLRCHAHVWGEPPAGSERPPLVLLHGWMDVGASFQFIVDALDPAAAARLIVAPDWRGFGLSTSPATDSYWFPDYLADLDALLDQLSPGRPVDLLGHSMGGNVAMLYAGVRPGRVRRLVNLEGFGLPETTPEQAPKRYAAWLDELKQPARLRDFASREEVAQRLRQNSPRLAAERAHWLAGQWAEPDAQTGRWTVRGDPAHKRANPVLHRAAETLACWARIEAPVLWMEGRQTDMHKFWGGRYSSDEFQQRLKRVPQVEQVVIDDAGHMLHLEQPEQVARHVARFLADPDAA